MSIRSSGIRLIQKIQHKQELNFQNSTFNRCCFAGECLSFVKTQKLIERELPFIGGTLRRWRRSFVRLSESALILRPRRRPSTAGGGKPSVQWEKPLLAVFAAKSPLPAGFLLGMPQFLQNLGAPAVAI